MSELDLMGYITVNPVDKSKFKFAFKSTTTSTELIKMVCDRAGIKQPHFFGLKMTRLSKAGLDNEVIPKVWVSETVPLSTHGCDSSTELYLRHKYWFLDPEEFTDEVTLQLVWEETDMKLMSGHYQANEDANIQLAACKAQLLLGDFDKDKKLTEESLLFLVPNYIRNIHTFEDWAKVIGVFHEKLKGFKKDDVQRQYMVLARDNATTIQTIFFPAQYSTRDMKSKVKVLIGVQPDGVGFYTIDKERRKLQVFHHFRDLKSWMINALWSGLEAPDFDRRSLGNVVFETDPLALGPYRSQLFLKARSTRTKDLEIEVGSFLSEDDGVITTMEYYRKRLEQYYTVLALEEDKDRFLQLSTLEGVSKRIRVPREMTGRELMATFAAKIGMTDTAFFQLSHVTDGCDKWVAFKESVLGQGLSESTPLTLKLRFFWKNPIDVIDPITRTLYYLQCKAGLINGELPITELESIDLAGLSLQHTYGTFDKKKKYGFSTFGSLKDYIPFYLLDFHPSSWWEKKIIASHEKYSSLTKDEALMKYLAILSILPNYGISYFSGIVPRTDAQCFIGVGKLGLALFKHDNMELITSYRFGFELRSYINDGEAIELKIRPSRHAEERTVIIVSLQFAEIIELLTYYEKMKKREKQLDLEDGEVANI